MTDQTNNEKTKISGRFEEKRWPLISEGEYIAVIKSWDTFPAFDRHKLLISCELEYDGQKCELAYFCNLKIDKAKNILAPSKRSNLSKISRTLLEAKDSTYDLNDLPGIQCIVKVGTCTQDDRKVAKKPSDYYSVIRSFRLPENVPEEDLDDIPF